MVSIATSERARLGPGRPTTAGSRATIVGRASIFGAMDGFEAGPQAFHVCVAGEIVPHFHVVDQFQVFLTGRGEVGKHALEPVTVHYVDHHTPYGPIRVTGESLSFFTLRPSADTGSHRMPGSVKSEPSGRSFTVPAHFSRGGRDLLPPQDDGLAARAVTLAAREALAEQVDVRSGGEYWIVADGEAEIDGELLAPLSLVWVGAQDATPDLVAGEQGAEILILRFPQRAI